MSGDEEKRSLRQRNRNSAKYDLALERILGDYLVSEDESEFLAELEEILSSDQGKVPSGRKLRSAARRGPVSPSDDHTHVAATSARPADTLNTDGDLLNSPDEEGERQDEAGEASVPGKANPARAVCSVKKAGIMEIRVRIIPRVTGVNLLC